MQSVKIQMCPRVSFVSHTGYWRSGLCYHKMKQNWISVESGASYEGRLCFQKRLSFNLPTREGGWTDPPPDADLGGRVVQCPMQTPCRQTPPKADPLDADPPVVASNGGHCSGRYAFYWNTFLLTVKYDATPYEKCLFLKSLIIF